MKRNNKYLKAIIEVFSKYGSPLKYSELNNFIEKEGYSFVDEEHWKADVRSEIYRNSSDSGYKNKPTIGSPKDLFYKKEKGVWGLRETVYLITEEERDELKEQYEEGGREERISKKPIRNSKLAKDYKEYLRKKQQGKIWCEICHKWENEEYLLQVHHSKKALSEYEEEGKTYSTFEDVQLVCVICHKRIHNVGLEKTIELAK